MNHFGIAVNGRISRKILKARNIKSLSTGYTLIELVVVAARLSVLAAIATLNIINFAQEGRVDEAKAVVNAALAECIREANQSQTAVADVTPQIFIGSNHENKLPTGYSFDPGTSGKCDMIAIFDKIVPLKINLTFLLLSPMCVIAT